MFREMRRKKQALSTEEINKVMSNGTSGVLALSGDDGYPYAVPINYVYDGEKRAAIEKLALRYAPEDSAANRQAEIDREWNILCLMEMTIEHITGKEAVELVKRRHNDEN